MERNFAEVSNWLNSSLNNRTILIKNTKKRRVCKKKIKGLIKCGFDSMQIISDLDCTLTSSTIDLLTKNPLMPEWYKLNALERRKQWAAVDSNSGLGILEKVEAVEQLSKNGQVDLLKCNITKESMKRIFQAAEAEMPRFREFTSEVLNLLCKYKVPVNIISAGWGDAQIAVLKYNDLEFENVQLIANYLEFANVNLEVETDCPAIGFIPPLIHMYNKHCVKLDSKSTETRSNVILLGDLIPDIQMASQIVQKNAILLKIGFLNDENASKERIDSYLNAFDVVIWKDESMQFFYDLLKFMQVK